MAGTRPSKDKQRSLRQTFARNVRLYRIYADFSQEELADLCELDRTFISSLERGVRNISIDNIERIAAALRVPPVTLLDPDMPANIGLDETAVRVSRSGAGKRSAYRR